MKISALIPFKSDDGGIRDRNLAYVRKRYEVLMPDVELVIGEDGSELFNRAKAINQAAAKATGNLLMIVDGDIFFGTKLIDKIMAIAHEHPWIIPFSRGYKLSLEMSRKVTESGTIQLPDRIRPVDIEGNCFYYGAFINVIPRKAFEIVGGMDERFFGWGGEEEALALALDTLVGKHYRMDETIFHLWHPQADIQHPHHQQNDELKERYYRVFENVPAMVQLIQERHPETTGYFPYSRETGAGFTNGPAQPIPQLKRVNLLASQYCNLHCRMCDYPVFFSTDQQLSLDRIKQITAEAAGLGAEILELAGGEPMTRHGIYEIISSARSVGMDVMMVTNGVLIGDSETKQLIKAGITDVSISLEGPEPLNDWIRGRGNYQKALNTIRNFLGYQAKHPYLKVTVGITLSKYNYKFIVGFAKYLLEEIGVNIITINPFTPDLLVGENLKSRPREFDIPAELIPDLISVMNQLREYAATVPDKLPSPGFLSKIPDYFSGKRLVPTGGCQIPSLYCGIEANGLVHPCWKYPPIGDLNRSSLSEIWGSKNHQEFREQALAGQCKGCLLSCYPENY